MEEKNNLYIVAIVGIVAVVALAILILGGVAPKAADTTSSTADQAGQAIAGACRYQCQNVCSPVRYCNNETYGNVTNSTCYDINRCTTVCGTICGKVAAAD